MTDEFLLVIYYTRNRHLTTRVHQKWKSIIQFQSLEVWGFALWISDYEYLMHLIKFRFYLLPFITALFLSRIINGYGFIPPTMSTELRIRLPPPNSSVLNSKRRISTQSTVDLSSNGLSPTSNPFQFWKIHAAGSQNRFRSKREIKTVSIFVSNRIHSTFELTKDPKPRRMQSQCVRLRLLTWFLRKLWREWLLKRRERLLFVFGFDAHLS